MKTACCDYQCKDDDFGPAFTNTGNNVVQCHNCGEVYVPRSEVDALCAALEAARVAVTGLPELHEFGCTGEQYGGRCFHCDGPELVAKARLALGLDVK